MSPLDPATPYKRTPMDAAILGINGKRLYGINLNTLHYCTSDDQGSNWKDSGFAAPTVTPGNTPIQMVFAGSFQFAFDDAGHIYRNKIDVFGPTPWTNVSVPNLPAGTTGRPDSLVYQGQFLFYGNYNFAQTPPTDPNNPGAHVYRSANFGQNWTEVLAVKTARHVHAIGVDPFNNNHVFVSIGDRFYTCGLWYSSANGGPNTFRQISSNRYGIDFAFPKDYASNWTFTDYQLPTGPPVLRNGSMTVSRLLLEGDWPPAAIETFDKSVLASLGPNDMACTDVLLWSEVCPPDGPSWACSGAGIKLNAAGNLFWISNGENGGIGLRSGVWLAQGPDFCDYVLLEDLAPPIATISRTSGMVSITTGSPNTFAVGDNLVIDGVTNPDYNSVYDYADQKQQVFEVSSVASATAFVCFDPVCMSCGDLPPSTGGVARKVTGWNYFKTFEQGPFLFNYVYRITVPKFSGQ